MYLLKICSCFFSIICSVRDKVLESLLLIKISCQNSEAYTVLYEYYRILMYCRCVSLHRVFTNLAGTYCMLQVLMEGQLSTILIQVPKDGGENSGLYLNLLKYYVKCIFFVKTEFILYCNYGNRFSLTLYEFY